MRFYELALGIISLQLVNLVLLLFNYRINN